MPTFICAQGFAEPLRCRRSLHALRMSNFFASSGIAQRSQVRIFARCEHHDASRAHAWQKDELLVYYYSNHPETALAATKQKDGTEKGQTKLPAARDLRFRALRHTHLLECTGFLVLDIQGVIIQVISKFSFLPISPILSEVNVAFFSPIVRCCPMFSSPGR